MSVVVDGGGRKEDSAKLRYDLVPPEALEGWVKVLTIGASKYTDRNWERGIEYSRVYAALLRHLQSWVQGEDNDPMDGQHHLDSVIWNAAALRTYEARDMQQFDNLRRKKGSIAKQ